MYCYHLHPKMNLVNPITQRLRCKAISKTTKDACSTSTNQTFMLGFSPKLKSQTKLKLKTQSTLFQHQVVTNSRKLSTIHLNKINILNSEESQVRSTACY